MSYVKYLADRLTGLSFNPALADKLTLYLFLLSLVISAVLNIMDHIRRKRIKE